MNFLFASRADTNWISAGQVSTFPDLGGDAGCLAEPRLCGAQSLPGCKVFRVPEDEPHKAEEVAIVASDDADSLATGLDLTNQVLVFRYRGRFHAIDHSCPHSAYPLSKGTPFDIEDFGIVLSSGLTCPRHGWSFDLFTGTSDTGRYELPLWEVQVRDEKGVKIADASKPDAHHVVWLRRKPRLG